MAVVFGLSLEGKLKIAQQGFGLELGARKGCEGAVHGVGIVAGRRKPQRPHPVVAQGVGRLVVGLNLHESGHRGRHGLAGRTEVVLGHPVPQSELLPLKAGVLVDATKHFFGGVVRRVGAHGDYDAEQHSVPPKGNKDAKPRFRLAVERPCVGEGRAHRHGHDDVYPAHCGHYERASTSSSR